MGSRKKSQPTVVQTPDTSAMQQQYQQSLQQIQQQSAQAFSQIQKANETTVQTLNQQLAQSQQTNADYQSKLNEYLGQVQAAQVAQQQAVNELSTLKQQQQDQMLTETQGDNLVNNLQAANQIASKQFKSKTSRQRGVIV